MSDSIKAILSNHPLGGISTAMGGYIISLTEMLSPIFRFLILTFSTITAISVAYIQYNRARRVYVKDKDPSKKGNSNSG